MILEVLQIKNKLGLHARAAAKLVRLATCFSSEIYLSREGERQRIDSKSILGILMLAASQGTRLEVLFEGVDEEAASQAIRCLFEQRFGEEE